jgi:hypothetical protein
MMQMRDRWYERDHFRPKVIFGIHCRADSTLRNAYTRPGSAGGFEPGGRTCVRTFASRQPMVPPESVISLP